MAGIGFTLDRFFKRGTYAATFGAYLTAALLFAGPWLLSIASMLALRVLALPRLGLEEGNLFLTAVNYSFCASMILTGLTSLVLVRGLSDRLYSGDREAILPLFILSSVLSGALHLVIGTAFWLPQDLPVLEKIWFVALFVAAGQSWGAIMYLDCLSRYTFTLLSMVGGYAASVLLAAGLGPAYGVVGMTLGFTAGLVFSFGCMAGRLFAEFHRPGAPFGRCLRIPLHPALIGIGFLYNLALSSDRLTFWIFHPFTQKIGPFASYPPYDLAILLATLTTLPGQALIVFRLEMAFFRRQVNFQQAIAGRGGLSTIEKARAEIVDSLILSVERVIAIQGSVTLIAVLLAPQIISACSLPHESVYMFRSLAVGALLGILLFGTLLVMLYLTFYRMALVTAGLFFAFQVGGTLVSLRIGFPAFGFGYLAACLLTLAFAVPALGRGLRNLDYYTLARQPVSDE